MPSHPPPTVLPSPGPPPRPPVIPSAAMVAVYDAIDQLVAAAEASRSIHERSVRTSTDVAHFEGAAATAFRTQLVGQLRRLRAMVVDLEADLDVIAVAQRTARDLEVAHADALRAHRAAVAAHRASLDAYRGWSLAQGLGPREPTVGGGTSPVRPDLRGPRTVPAAPTGPSPTGPTGPTSGARRSPAASAWGSAR